MTISFHPAQGTILIYDFRGFLEPEIVKRRPVIAVSPKFKDRHGLCTIVPLSTSPPRPIRNYHYRLRTDPPMPAPYSSEWQWVKADMLYTVSFERLHLPFDSKDAGGKRIYDMRTISPEDLEKIQQCIRYGLGLSV